MVLGVVESHDLLRDIRFKSVVIVGQGRELVLMETRSVENRKVSTTMETYGHILRLIDYSENWR